MFKDKELREASRNEEKYIETVIGQHYEEIYKYCCRHLSQKEYAEDITQEVFLNFISHIEQYREFGKIRNYLYVIARNMIINFGKRKAAMPDYDGKNYTEPKETEKIVERLYIADKLTSMDELDRELLILRYYQELRIKDISIILDMPASTVRYKMKSAEKKLKLILEEDDV